MTVVMTPDREPFFAGTYFPPRDGVRGARRGFLGILQGLAAEYAESGDEVAQRAAELVERMRASARPAGQASLPDTSALLSRSVGQLGSTYDRQWGGFGRAPKFPRPTTLEVLMRYFRRTREPHARDMFVGTLEAMANGGIHDHVGGGFHRYSVDQRWLVPHFEKMLYDNAQLAVAYLEAAQLADRDDFAAVARKILDYVAREMTSPEGGFYSASDADSAGPDGHTEEGLFFTWTPSELEAALGENTAKSVAAYYGVSEGGNFEGRSILHTWRPLVEVADEVGLEPDALAAELDAARAELYRVREGRIPPIKDTKVLAAWNGLMISAFARGAAVLGEDRYRDIARAAADFVLERMFDGGRLARSYRAGSTRHAGVLDDYAFLAAGLLDLFEVDSDPRWFDAAVALHTTLEERFWHPDGGAFYLTPDDGERLLVREKPDYDGARPSGNSVAIANLLRLYHLTTDEHYFKMAEQGLLAFASDLTRRGLGIPRLLSTLDAYEDVHKEIVLVTRRNDTDVSAFRRKLAGVYLPNKAVVVVREGDDLERLSERIPWVGGKKVQAGDGDVTAYVCEERVCKLPTADLDLFARQLVSVAPYPGG